MAAGRAHPKHKLRAIEFARLAVEADTRGDVAHRDDWILELWSVIGYWKQPNNSADTVRMFRMPLGRGVEWDKRFDAAVAWAMAGKAANPTP